MTLSAQQLKMRCAHKLHAAAVRAKLKAMSKLAAIYLHQTDDCMYSWERRGRTVNQTGITALCVHLVPGLAANSKLCATAIHLVICRCRRRVDLIWISKLHDSEPIWATSRFPPDTTSPLRTARPPSSIQSTCTKMERSPHSTEVKNAWGFISTPPTTCFHGMVLKYSGNFICITIKMKRETINAYKIFGKLLREQTICIPFLYSLLKCFRE
jgi:hypothetical protein